MSDARKRAEEARLRLLAADNARERGYAMEDCAVALEALLAEEPGAPKSDSMHAPQPERTDLPPEVRGAAERLKATGEEMARLDEHSEVDAFVCLHALVPRFIREAKALLSALAARRGA